MFSKGVTCWLSILLISFHAVQARFVIEQAGLKIVLPEEAKKQYRDGFDTSLGNFGAPVYGGELIGKLVYPDSEYGYETDIKCSPPCKYACQPFNESNPKFDLHGSQSYILLADRGPTENGMTPCKFAEKTWNAQLAGAKGIIVANYEEKHTTMYAPEDDEESYKWLKNITIPAVFVLKSTGDVLRKLLKEKKDVYVSLDWHDALPRKQQVEWQFWTNSNDMCGAVCDVQKEFIKEFAPVAKDLEQHNWTRFTPHYKVWKCPDSYKESEECKKQCVHKGRYCSPDPETDSYEGKHIVQENLRQLCFFKMASAHNKPWLWWDYVTQFAEKCKMSDETFGKECADKIFTKLGGNDFGGKDAFEDCIGDEDADSNNPVLEAELDSQAGTDSVGEVYILPTVRINNAQYRGKFALPEVLRAICTGFNKDNEPEECLKVSENECLEGGPGDSECKENTNGKTRCINTFIGYKCTCGDGFYPHMNGDGEEECLDINECYSAGTSLSHNCTCDRCACQNTWGSYTCIKDLPNYCTPEKSYGNCWHANLKVNGKEQFFSACQDTLYMYKQAAARGDDVTNKPLYSCECPPCFEEVVKSDGYKECKPKCNLDTCDMNTGVCPSSGSSGVPGWTFALIVLLIVLVVAAGGYFVYWVRLRSAMHQEIRAIMAQYMPLEAQGGTQLPSGPPPTNATEMIKTQNGL